MTTWAEAQVAEVAWWNDWEGSLLWAELEQVEMARLMGLEVDDRYTVHTSGTIWDVGGGPLSLLLKSVGWDRAVVIDPARYPIWTALRYEASGIHVWRASAEAVFSGTAGLGPDEVWCYNVLQHVEDPETVLAMCVNAAPVVRLFDWVDQMTNEVHLHTLDTVDLERWAREAGGEVECSTGLLNGTPYFAAVIR